MDSLAGERNDAGSHHHHRRHREPGRAARFFRQYRFEVIWAGFVLLAVFLLFERMNIRRTIIAWLRGVLGSLGNAAAGLDDLARFAAQHLTVSDALGMVLILGALAAMLWRIRWRLLHTPSLAMPLCPACKGAAHRVHRNVADHILDRFVPVHRYSCANQACGWEGLRINDGTHHREHRHRRAESASSV